MLTNSLLHKLGLAEFDPAPFSWLQGIVGLGVLLTSTAVLTRQNRLAKLAEQRAYQNLKVMLLKEQKAAKLIDLFEELRRDLPNVKNRHDPEAAALQQSMSPELVLAALDERSEPDEQLKAVGEISGKKLPFNDRLLLHVYNSFTSTKYHRVVRLSVLK